MSGNGLDSDILEAVRSVIAGPSAVVSKVTRMGFTTSAAALARAENFNILIVSPTKKIGAETVRGADDGALIVYGHSHCRKLQDAFARDRFLEKLPLPLPSDCPCSKYTDCDYTNAWFDSAPVRAMTYAKLKSIMLVDSKEATCLKGQLGDVDVFVLDESHKISLPQPPKIDLGYRLASIPWQFETLREIYYDNFPKLNESMREDGEYMSIEAALKIVGTNYNLAIPYTNSYAVPWEKLRMGIGELIKLARNREKYSCSEADILYLMSVCYVMADDKVCLSYIRSSEGDQWNLMGTHTVEQNAIKSFIREVCPHAKVLFVSGTQFESCQGLFEELAGRKLQTICLPDVKSNNRSLTIFSDTWKADTRNIWPKFDEICQRIREISALEKGAKIYLATQNIRTKALLESALKKELPNISFDYYRSANSIGVANEARVGIYIGFPATPTNAMDFACPTYEASQELRQLEMLSTAWQTMSRVKDWQGKTPSRHIVLA
jgi:hypothetical protein